MTTAAHDFKYASGKRRPLRVSARGVAAALKTFGRKNYSRKIAKMAVTNG